MGIKHKIFIIDDNREILTVLKDRLEYMGFDVDVADSKNSALSFLTQNKVDVIVLDAVLGADSGIQMIEEIKRIQKSCPILIYSGYGHPEMIVEAMKCGATDYVQKAQDFGEIFFKIKRLIEFKQDAQESQELAGDQGQRLIIGKSHKGKQLLFEIDNISNSEGTVFLRGESGTGKSLIAELIHLHSHRKGNPFVVINCAAIPENLLETELFGHEKGAFTGALKQKIGKFEFANHGTIFLDEIGDLSPELQVKILRVLQSQEFERVGGLETIHVNVRVIAATNRNIEKHVQEHKFREDLFYRLNVLPIYVPALRERRDDISLLANYFLEIFCKKTNKNFSGLSDKIIHLLMEYDWPGNIRELQNVIERAVIVGKEPHLNLSNFIISQVRLSSAHQSTIPVEIEASSIGEIEYKTMKEALLKSGGNITKAARMLGIARNTLYRRMKKYHIKQKQEESELFSQ